MVDEHVKAQDDIRTRVAKVFAGQPNVPVDLIANKIEELRSRAFIYGTMVLKSIELYQWTFVDRAPKPVNDHRQGIQINPKDYVQLAKRLHRSIIVDRALWNKMDDANRAALVFHEAIYAFATPRKNHKGYKTQLIGAVQELIAFIFSTNVTYGNIGEMLRDVFPEKFFFLGQFAVKEEPGRVERNGHIKFYVGNHPQSDKSDWQTAVSLRVDSAGDSETAEAIQYLCPKVKKETEVHFDIVNVLYQFYIDVYEG